MGVVLLLIIFGSFYKAEKEIEGFLSKEALCEKATSIPSWFNWRGDIIDKGYKQMALEGKNNSEGIVDLLIEQEVTFVYSSGCGWCHKQIEWFGAEQWAKYQEAGLTRDCDKQ